MPTSYQPQKQIANPNHKTPTNPKTQAIKTTTPKISLSPKNPNPTKKTQNQNRKTQLNRQTECKQNTPTPNPNRQNNLATYPTQTAKQTKIYTHNKPKTKPHQQNQTKATKAKVKHEAQQTIQQTPNNQTIKQEINHHESTTKRKTTQTTKQKLINTNATQSPKNQPTTQIRP